jgi:alpha-glucuronidase
MTLALCAALGVTVLGLSWRWSRRKPGVPISWQTSQSVAADLHRRVHRSLDRTRRSVADARKRGVPTEAYEAMIDELVATARALDDQLVLASRLPFRQRHKSLLTLRYRIVEIERTGERISRSAIEVASPLVESVDDSIARINQRLDHVEQAKQELRDVDGTV